MLPEIRQDRNLIKTVFQKIFFLKFSALLNNETNAEIFIKVMTGSRCHFGTNCKESKAFKTKFSHVPVKSCRLIGRKLLFETTDKFRILFRESSRITNDHKHNMNFKDNFLYYV